MWTKLLKSKRGFDQTGFFNRERVELDDLVPYYLFMGGDTLVKIKAKPYIQGDLVLAVDFDGTITNEPDMGIVMTLKDHAQRVLTRLYDDGVRMQLWTCRTGPNLEQAVEFLHDNDLLHVFESINDHLPEIVEKYAPNHARKLGADFYIDDKNIMFEVDWLRIEEFIYGEAFNSEDSEDWRHG